MTTLSTVLLSTSGDCRKANIQLNADRELTMENIQKYFKKKETPEMVCHYKYDHKVIFLFGYQTGKKGKENKTEIPPPYSELTLFGDILVIAALTHEWNRPIPYTIDHWNAFAQKEEEEEEEEEEENAENAEEKEAPSPKVEPKKNNKPNQVPVLSNSPEVPSSALGIPAKIVSKKNNSNNSNIRAAQMNSDRKLAEQLAADNVRVSNNVSETGAAKAAPSTKSVKARPTKQITPLE